MKDERLNQGENDLPIELANPARRALVEAGYRRLDQVATLSASEAGRLHGVGPKSLDQLRRALGANGLSFAGEKPQNG